MGVIKIDDDGEVHFDGPQHINEDESQPWRQCEWCGKITKAYHVQTFGRPENPLTNFKRILCIKCGRHNKKFWDEVNARKTKDNKIKMHKEMK